MKIWNIKKHFYYFIFLIIILILIIFIFMILLRRLSYDNQLKDHHSFIQNLSDIINTKYYSNYLDYVKKLSENKEIKKILKNELKIDDEKVLNILYNSLNLTDSEIIYVLDINGDVVASTVSEGISLTGNNYSFREYFIKAAEGNSYFYPALGVTTSKRGLYFSSPVYDINYYNIIGVLVFKVGFNEIDNILSQYDFPILLTSVDNIVFSANNMDWIFKSIFQLSDETIEDIQKSQQFSDIKIESLEDDLLFKEYFNKKNYNYNYIYIYPYNLKIHSFFKKSFNYPLTRSQSNTLLILFIIIMIIYIFVLLFILNIIKRINLEKEYSLVVENASEGIFVLQDNGIVKFHNKKLESIINKKFSYKEKLNIFDYVHPDYLSKVKDLYKRRLNGEDVEKYYETKMITADKDNRSVMVNAVKIEWNDRPASLVFIRDISDLKEAEKKLITSTQRYQVLINNMHEGVMIFEETRKILLVNKSFCNMIDLDENEILSNDIVELFDDLHYKKFIIRLIKNKITNLFEFKWFDKNKKERIFLLSPSIIKNNQNDLSQYMIIFTDMTLIKHLQERFVNLEKMELMGRLAGNVAHDLNNILAGIVSLPDLLLLDLSNKEFLRESINIIKHSGQKAAAIVDDLLTISRRNIKHEQIINLNDLISNYLKSPEHYEYIKEHAKIKVNFYPEKSIFNIKGTALQLAKVLMNLINNSIDAMPDGGIIEIRTGNIYNCKKLINKKLSNCVMVEISDTGKGIAKEDINKIFEPFYSKKNNVKSGTGLGLSIVYGVIKDHNGIIEIKSEENKGTTFSIYFPATLKKIAEENIDNKKVIYGNQELILVIEDDEDQRDLIEEIIKFLNYRVICCSTRQEAIKYYIENKPKLVILDMILSGEVDGLDVYEEIKNNSKNSDLKAIIVSGYGEKSRIKKVLENGINDFIKKPYTIDVLSQVIHSVLEK